MSESTGSPLRLSGVRDQRIAVWGGRSDGTAAVATALEQGCTVTLVTDDPAGDADTAALAARHGLDIATPADLERLEVEVVIRSPGVPRYRPELVEFHARGGRSANLLALWLADQPAERIVGVTGTKGKSTTTTFIHRLLLATGRRAAIAGNVGVPATEVPDDAEVVALEVSSYQASDCEVSPMVGVLTSLGIDHLTWHGTPERYHADKLRLFAHPQLRTLIGPDDPPDPARALFARLGGRPSAWELGDGVLVHQGAERVALPAGAERGPMARNLLLAVRAVEALHGLDGRGTAVRPEVVAEVTAAYEGLPCRQQIVDVVDGVTWVDDLLATNPLAAGEALTTFAGAPLVLIVGGDDRGVDLSGLRDALADAVDVTTIVVLGPPDDPFARRLLGRSPDGPDRLDRRLGEGAPPLVWIDDADLGRAVVAAAERATPGGRVVLCPMAPTPARQGTYRDRSAAFAAAVAALPGGRTTPH